MKTTLALIFAVLVASAAHAQILRPEAIHRPAIGGHARQDVRPAAPAHRGPSGGHYIYRHSPYGYRGYTHAAPAYVHYPRHRSYYGYYGYGPSYHIGYYPGYDYGYPYADYGYGSYGSAGLFWGGLAGAIIGHNSGTFHHNAWRGAAWGAATGWLLGSVADANRRAAYNAPVVTPVVQAQPAATAQPQPVTIINNYYNAPATPMSAANGLFGRN